MSLASRSVLSMAAAVLVMAHPAPAAAQPPGSTQPPAVEPAYPPLTGPDAEAVRDVVRQYQAAIQRRDGAAAARLVSRDTRAYYGRIRDLAVSATEEQVRAAPLMDRITILLYRHRTPPAELRALAADQAFAHTISAGWVTATEGEELASGSEVFGEGDRAILRYDGDTHFVREDGAWRWDMMPLIQAANAEMEEGMASREEQDEFAMFVLKQSDGRDPSPDIWQPLP
ncbi:MAG TPA: hypothetical protein VEQ60_14405 [Longimicrobium sp.]|nr:hypothetical protein [Longimicrobium sp.]